MIKLLRRPLWAYGMALMGVLAITVVLLDALVVLVAWLAGISVGWTWVWVFDVVLFCGALTSVTRYLWTHFVRVKPSAAKAFPYDVGPWLHWTGDPRTTMDVTWVTREPGPTLVELGCDPGDLARVTGAAGRLHRVHLTNLDPGTRYFYRLLDFPPDQAIHEFTTAPPAGETLPAGVPAPVLVENRPVTFLVVGDTQNGGGPGVADWAFPPLVEGMRQQEYDLLMHVGDLVDQGNDLRSWHVTLQAVSQLAADHPFHVAVGNHDTGSHYLQDAGVKHYPDEGANFDYFLGYAYRAPPDENQITPFHGRYHAFAYGRCHFVFLDTQNRKMAAEWNPQWVFLDRYLGGVPAGHWKFAFVHWPQQEIVNDEQGGFRYRYPKFAPFLTRLFDKHGVDAVFQGHNHIYRCVEWRYDPEVPFFREEDAWPHSVIPYITTGAGGNELRRNPGRGPTDVPLRGFHYDENSTHYLKVTVTGTRCRVEALYPDNTRLDDQEIVIEKSIAPAGSSATDA